MQLPRYTKNKQTKLKLCKEPGCGKEFIGHPIAKYCEAHRSANTRVRVRAKHESPDVKNQIFQHSFYQATDIEFTCDLPGCNEKFVVRALPKQFVYPKYCGPHRVEFKRKLFLRRNKCKKLIMR